MNQIESWRFCYLRVPGEYLPRLTPGNFYEPLSPDVAKLAAESWAKRHSYLLRENHETTAPIPDRRWTDFCAPSDREICAGTNRATSDHSKFRDSLKSEHC